MREIYCKAEVSPRFYNFPKMHADTLSSQPDMTSSVPVIQSLLAATASRTHDRNLVYQDPYSVCARVDTGGFCKDELEEEDL